MPGYVATFSDGSTKSLKNSRREYTHEKGFEVVCGVLAPRGRKLVSRFLNGLKAGS